MTQQPSDSQPSLLSGNTTDSENLDEYRDFYLVGEQCIRATNFPWRNRDGEFEQTVSVDSTLWLMDFMILLQFN